MLEVLLSLAVLTGLGLLVRRGSRPHPADPSATAAVRRAQVTQTTATQAVLHRQMNDSSRYEGGP